MTPFVEIKRNALVSMLSRQRLMEMPLEFFSRYCGGRIPTLEEKLFYVEQAVQELTPQHLYENDVYEVQVFHRPPFIHLSINRRDGLPFKTWEDFQWIKNEIVGKEREAVELFPAQRRIVDSGHEYHLWVHADPQFRFPLGFEPSPVPFEPEVLPGHIKPPSLEELRDMISEHSA